MSATRPTNPENGEESMEDIKDSLDRIEELLSRGHQLLYGEDDLEDPLGVQTPKAGEPDERYDSPAARPTEPQAPEAAPRASTNSNGTTSSGYRPKAYPDGGPSRYGLPNRPVKTVTQTSTFSRSTEPAATTSTPLGSKKPQANQSVSRRSNTASVSRSRRRGGSGAMEESATIYESAARLRDARAMGKPLPNLEEGVDDDDVPQDVSIEELKARIHRELEEYRRNGPLMKRRKSVMREQKRKSRGPTKVQVNEERREEEQAIAASHPLRSSMVQSRKSTAAPRPTATRSTVPRATATPARYSAPKSRTTPTTTTAPAPASRSAVRPTATRAPASRAAPAPQTRSAEPPKTSPPRAAEAQGRLTIWERLYNDAAAQQEKLERKREQARVDQDSRQTQPATNYNRRLRGSGMPRRTSAPLYKSRSASRHHDDAPASAPVPAAARSVPTYPIKNTRTTATTSSATRARPATSSAPAAKKPLSKPAAKTAAKPPAKPATKAPVAKAEPLASSTDFKPLALSDQKESPENASLDATPIQQTQPVLATPDTTAKRAVPANGGRVRDSDSDSSDEDEAANVSSPIPVEVTPLDFRNLKK